MKPCHAAVLALVGWYLMMPPFVKVGPGPRDPGRDRVPDSDAPLSKWFWAGSFDSVDACQRSQEKEISRTQRRNSLSPSPPAETGTNVKTALQRARCIDSDDPRLKEK